MKVLVSGGAGFVGRHFVCRLVDDGHEVMVVDNMSAGLRRPYWPFKPAAGLHSFVIREYDVRDYFKTNAPDDFDLIIHCAAVVGGRLKIDGDPLAVATDMAIDADLFNWIVRAKKMPKLIYFSSSAAYPIELQTDRTYCDLAEALLSWDATRFGIPDQTYGFSKFAGEFLAQSAARNYGLDVVIYRPFGGYGEDQDVDAYPFPAIIRRVLRKEDPIVVWGSGRQVRDFIHIDDIVEGVLASMNLLKPGQVLNLGTGRGVSFVELAQLACDLLGHKAQIEVDDTKPQGVFRRVADTCEMEKFYWPAITLEAGIKRVADYLAERL